MKPDTVESALDALEQRCQALEAAVADLSHEVETAHRYGAALLRQLDSMRYGRSRVTEDEAAAGIGVDR